MLSGEPVLCCNTVTEPPLCLSLSAAVYSALRLVMEISPLHEKDYWRVMGGLRTLSSLGVDREQMLTDLKVRQVDDGEYSSLSALRHAVRLNCLCHLNHP